LIHESIRLRTTLQNMAERDDACDRHQLIKTVAIMSASSLFSACENGHSQAMAREAFDENLAALQALMSAKRSEGVARWIPSTKTVIGGWLGFQRENVKANGGDGQGSMARGDPRREAFEAFVAEFGDMFPNPDAEWAGNLAAVQALMSAKRSEGVARWIPSTKTVTGGWLTTQRKNIKANGGEGVQAMARGDPRREAFDAFVAEFGDMFPNPDADWYENLAAVQASMATERAKGVARWIPSTKTVIGGWIVNQRQNIKANGGEGVQAMARGDPRREAFDAFVAEFGDMFPNPDTEWAGNLAAVQASVATERAKGVARWTPLTKTVIGGWLTTQRNIVKVNGGEGQGAMARGDPRREAFEAIEAIEAFVAENGDMFPDADAKRAGDLAAVRASMATEGAAGTSGSASGAVE
jgi:hypothetical protein